MTTIITTGESAETPDTPPAATPEAVATEAAIELAREAGAATEAARNAESDAMRAQMTAETANERMNQLEATVARLSEHISSVSGNLESRVTEAVRLAISQAAEQQTTTEAEADDGSAAPVTVDVAPPADVPAAATGRGRGLWGLLLGTRQTT